MEVVIRLDFITRKVHWWQKGPQDKEGTHVPYM